ncbi:MAG: Ig-like domain-containing protein [Myxococcota bacterium]
MKRILLGLMVFAAGCGGAVVKECESACTQGQRCDTGSGLCVKDEVPTLVLQALPNPLTTAKVTVRGTTKDDVGVLRGEASFAGQAPVAFTVTGDAFSVDLDVPLLDSADAVVTVKVFDTGDQPGEATATTIVDRVGPVVAIAEPDRVLGGPIITIAGTSEDGSGSVEQVQVDFGAGPVTATVAGGAWTVQLAPPAGRDVEDTPLSVTAKDKYGNVSASTLSVKLDTRGPAFSLTGPTATVGGTSTEVVGTVADTSGPVATVTVRFNGLSQDVAVVDGGFRATVMLPPGLDGDTRAVTFSAADRYGNSGTSDFDLTIDTRGPTLTLTGPSVLGASGELTGRAVDSAQPVRDVTVEVQGGSGPVPVDSFVNGDWRLAVTFPAGLDAVTRTVALSARDAFGNVGSGAGTITVDTAAPVGTISTPAANARLSGATATFSGTVSDSTSVQAVELDFADGQGFRSATVNGSSWAVDVPLPSTENDVGHVVTARFTDGLGNVSTVTRAVTVDNVAPTVAVTTPAAGTVVGGTATTVSVSVSAADPAGVTGVTVAIGSASPTPATRQGTSNTWTATLSLPTGQDFVTLQLRATATDSAGNTASAGVNLIVDNVPPVLTITAPTANQVFNMSNFTASGNVTITWTLTDGDPQASVKTVGASTTPVRRTARRGPPSPRTTTSPTPLPSSRRTA